jgi:23S rRNA (uracil1939-C5)-methyltransferase
MTTPNATSSSPQIGGGTSLGDGDSIVLRLAGKGDGVTVDGRYVPGTAPGDMVAQNGVITPGPHHMAPACRHYTKCGGCQLQHIDDASYSQFLHDRLSAALSAQQVVAPPLRTPHLSPPHSRRRALLKAQRIGRDVLIGFNESRSHKIIDMRQCPVLEPALFALIAPLRKLLATMLPRRGVGTIQLTMADQGVDMLLSGMEADGLDSAAALFDFAMELSLARLAIDSGNGPEDRWAPDPVSISFGGVPVPLPHAPFLQATRDGEATLIATVKEIVGPASTIADLFSGLGTFAMSLCDNAQVLAVEAARDAVQCMQRAANLHHRTVKSEHRDLYRRPLTPAELAKFGAVVLDPPRAGAEDQCVELAQSSAPVIAYVSCNPQSFARDAALLIAGGYQIDWIQPIGQFRWSTHMELVARLSRKP